jgi:hypothetical protein
LHHDPCALTARVAMGPPLAVIALLLLAPTAPVGTFNVNTTADHVEDKSCAAPSDCTLRDSVSVAGSADPINVPTGAYTLTQGEFSLLSDHIAGSGLWSVVISAGNANRVFSAAGSTSITGVTIRDGNGVGATASGAGGDVCVAPEAIVTISNSTIRLTNGGGIAATGGLALANVTVSGNTAAAHGTGSSQGIATSRTGGPTSTAASSLGQTKGKKPITVLSRVQKLTG